MPAIQRNTQAGFTLMEMTLVMAVMIGIAVVALPKIQQETDHLLVDKATEEMRMWLEAGMAYYRDTGSWPGDTSVLVTGGYMPSGSATGPWGSSYTLAPAAGRLQITYDAGEQKFAERISAELPLASVAGSVVTAEIVVPGTELVHDALLPRDGSRPMTGTLDMAGNDIADAGTVNANTFDASNEIVTPIMRDKDDTSYHVKPSGWSRMNNINIDGSGGQGIYLNMPDTNGNGTPDAFWLDTGLIRYAGVVNHGSYIDKPDCAHGSPQIFVSPMAFSPNSTGEAIGAVQSYAWSISGQQWRVGLRILTSGGWVYPNSTYGKITVQTKCG